MLVARYSIFQAPSPTGSLFTEFLGALLHNCLCTAFHIQLPPIGTKCLTVSIFNRNCFASVALLTLASATVFGKHTATLSLSTQTKFTVSITMLSHYNIHHNLYPTKRSHTKNTLHIITYHTQSKNLT